MAFNMNRRSVITSALALASAAALPARAQSFPEKPLHWIIYQSPGGLIDGSSRAIQPFLKDAGFDSTIDYVRGASGRIARTQLARAEPDGLTIMTEAGPEEVLGQVVYQASYTVDQLEPVYGWFVNAFNLYVRNDSAIKTMDDFIAEAKKRPITVATIGKGGPSHLQLALLKGRLGLQLQLVHFDGGTPAYTALSGGHVEAAIGGSSSVKWADTLTFLAVFRNGRDPALPDTPTVAELGLDIPPINEVIYINTTAGLPEDRLKALSAAFEKIFQNPDLLAAQKQIGVNCTPLTPDDLKKIRAQMFELVNEYKGELEA